MYHLVVLPGLPALKISDRPDGSYGTKDIFRPHPDNLSETDTRAGQARWKFVGRQGDIIVLVNGENADATPIEQKVILSPLVEMAIAFGAGHERLGLLVIPSQKAAGLSKEELIQSITPALELGNTLAAEYARISPDDIIVKPIGTPYPLTAKMTLQRPIMHQIFSEDIEAHYAAREQADVNIALSDEDVYGVVRRIVEEEVQKQAAVLSSAEAEGESTQDQGQIDDQTDFFSMGMDSLRASLIRGRLLREIPLPKGTKLAANVVFDYPNLGLLSDHIKRLRQSSEQDSSTVRDPAIIARAMVKKYTDLVTAKDDPKDDRVNGTTEKAATDNSHVIVSSCLSDISNWCCPVFFFLAHSRRLTCYYTGPHRRYGISRRTVAKAPFESSGCVSSILPRAHSPGTRPQGRGATCADCARQLPSLTRSWTG